MCNPTIRVSAALLLGVTLWVLSPAAARAQAWAVNVDVPITSTFRTKVGGDSGPAKVANIKVLGTNGVLASVTLPYHVGIGLEAYTQRVQPPDLGAVLDVAVQMLDVYVDLPVTSWFTFSPGVGWGKGTFSIEGKAPDEFKTPGDMNLWQFYAVAAVQLPWSLQLRLGYHESRGDLINKSSSAGATVHKAQPLETSLTTLGLGYTF